MTQLGDIFWDLPSWITYAAGYDLGCCIYVANTTDTVREYALMAVLSRDTTLISEGSIKVYGHAWFAVDPGDLIRLFGAIRLEETDMNLTVNLIERESEEIVDSISTKLVSPSLLPSLPGIVTIPMNDWMAMIAMVMMLGMTFYMLKQPESEEEKKRKEQDEGATEKKSLPGKGK
jgi:hypothetical protein